MKDQTDILNSAVADCQGMGMDVTLIEINPEYIDMQRDRSGLFALPYNP